MDQNVSPAAVTELTNAIYGNTLAANGVALTWDETRALALAVLADVLAMSEDVFPQMALRLGLMFVLQEFKGQRTVYLSTWDGRMWRGLRAVNLD